MTEYFFMALAGLALVELVKGLSANGTPPVLQRFSWQMDLAHFMWSNILFFRIVLGVAIAWMFTQIPAEARMGVVPGAVVILALWGFIYWLFNRYWVGRFKFLPITQKRFEGAATNKVDLKEQILGINHNGEAKAFPVNMLYYHHQISDEVGGHPIWPTYCGLCNSGRIYDRQVDGNALEFTLVGAVNYNATFRDHTTGSWWRQEVGDAIKGPMKGRALEDMPFEQMSLESWLAKHPESLVLQYDPTFQKQYNIRTALLNYEVSLPGWHMQASPPLVVGVVAGNVARAYDWNELVKRRLVEDEAGGTALLAVTDPDGDSAFVYDRTVDGTVLSFEMAGDGMRDTGTGSSWDCFGRCTKGKLKGKSLTRLQSYKQYVRAWVTFHPDASFFDFQHAG
tara:strand:- start:1156 stop:2340 length:1185 start_codon:yes stop_codon:yes gene_type:complete